MSDEEDLEVTAYTLNAWDCPACGYDHRTDVELSDVETCEGCGERVRIR